jgi:hypothetical protein
MGRLVIQVCDDDDEEEKRVEKCDFKAEKGGWKD